MGELLEFRLLFKYCSFAKKWKGEGEDSAYLNFMCHYEFSLLFVIVFIAWNTKEKVHHSNGASKKSSFLVTWKLTLPYVK